MLWVIFPEFAEYRANDRDSEAPNYVGVMQDFASFFGRSRATSSGEVQLRRLGELVNAAVAVNDELESAVSTCFLEHTGQTGAARAIRPFLSALARKKSNA